VIVAAAVYGTDNRCLLAALKHLGPQARGVITFPTDVDDKTLSCLHEAGVRGIRYNPLNGERMTFQDLMSLANRIRQLGWHIEIMCNSDMLREQFKSLLQLKIPLVIDHMARIPIEGGTANPALQTIKHMVSEGSTWVKISLAGSGQLLGSPTEHLIYETSNEIVDSCRGRVVWGSDWPHVFFTDKEAITPSCTQLIDALYKAAPDAQDRHSILVTAPGELYQFI
jgi:predicted TIM-barrel fold metal-dependent hydrolase